MSSQGIRQGKEASEVEVGSCQKGLQKWKGDWAETGFGSRRREQLGPAVAGRTSVSDFGCG